MKILENLNLKVLTLAVYYQLCIRIITGHTVAQLVEALHYKSEGHGFDFWWCHQNFTLI
jgi:hypothetical protein